MMVLINPGSRVGNSLRGLRRVADVNMRALCRDLGVPPRFGRSGRLEGDGWYGYSLRYGRCVEQVDMPGVPLDQLTARSPFAPRLYVDGNSWYWPFALNILRDAFGFERQEAL